MEFIETTNREALRVLDAVVPMEAGPDDPVMEGSQGTSTVGHIEARVPDDHIREAFNLVSLGVFVSTSGLDLLKMASNQRKALAASPLDDLSSGIVWIYVEIDGGSGVLANRAVTVVVRPGVTQARAEAVVRNMRFELPNLPGALRMTPKEFYDRIEDGLAETFPSLLGRAFDNTLEGLADLFDLAETGAKKLAEFLETNSRMPKELWSPRHRPKDWAAFMDGLRADQTRVLDTVEDGLTDLQVSVLARLNAAGKFLPNRARALLGRLKGIWIWIFDVVRGAIDLLRDMKPDLEETGETVLGFISGLWDGIMDAIIGFIEMLALGAKLAAANLRLHKGLGAAFQTALEFLEVARAALEKIDFDALWDWVQRAWPILWRAAWTRAEWAFDKVVSNSAMAGYYFGYIVYMVIEFFLPPLKASSLLKNGRRLASMKFFREVFT